MLFNSLTFLIFFPLMILGYGIVPPKLRNVYLLAASYIFYMGWNPIYSLLLTFSVLTTYTCGILLARNQSIQAKKLSVAAVFVVNLLILGVFKYFNFFADSVNTVALYFGLNFTINHLDLLLPVGISFYTFQALSYIIDVYRGEIECEKNIIDYALFVTFFPQMVAGPIERSKNLLRQIKNPQQRKMSYEGASSGLIVMLWGFFLKIVIADRVAILVDTVYNTYWSYGFFALTIATVAFAIQIYCDFASYSYIAMGCARVMGFRLMENFNTPYFSRSIKEFWRRWHISLSTWFKDYLYFPLGGSRKSKARTYINLMIVFLVSGIWHGANWTFVVWGALNGFYQIAGALLLRPRQWLAKVAHMKTNCFSHALGQTVITFGLTCFAWIFFRADSILDALKIIKRILTYHDFWCFFDGSIYTLGLARPEFNILLVCLGILFLVDLVKYKKGQDLDTFLKGQNIWFSHGVTIVLFMMCIIWGIYGPEFDAQAFIYFQF